MKNLDSEKNITELVHLFYDKVKTDEIIGPVFHAAIEESNWPKHLSGMSDFWKTVLLGEGSYRGNPFMKHKDLPISKQHFDRWIQLFKDTITAEFTGEKSKEAIMRASKMSDLFQTKLKHIRANPDKPSLM